MGDRTSVTLTVLAEHADFVDDIDSGDYGPDECEHTNPKLVEFTYSEVNYGELDFLDKLRDAGIAYDSHWDDGGAYRAGTKHLRFTADGQVVVKEVGDDDAPCLSSMIIMLEEPEPLERISTYLHTFKEKISEPSWDNQSEYGKVYRTRQLIAPQEPA